MSSGKSPHGVCKLMESGGGLENKLPWVTSNVQGYKGLGRQMWCDKVTNTGERRRLLFMQDGVEKEVRENLPDGL